MTTRTAEAITALQQMKHDGRKIVGVVAWDYQIARIVDRIGVDLVSVGDSVGVNLWGQSSPDEVTMDQMVVVCQAVRRGVNAALVSCDVPSVTLPEGPATAVGAAQRLVDEGGADLVKLDNAAQFPDGVTAVVEAGIPVFAEFEITAEIAARYGMAYRDVASTRDVPADMAEELVAQAQLLERAGAALLDFKNSGPAAGAAVAAAASIPVLGGFGGGPWLDGRIRMAHEAIGYPAASLDSDAESYANVAEVTLAAMTAYAEDVRAARQIKGAPRISPAS